MNLGPRIESAPLCEKAGVPVEYIRATRHRDDKSIRELWKAGIPASYVATATRLSPTPHYSGIIELWKSKAPEEFLRALLPLSPHTVSWYWANEVPLEVLRGYGLWAAEENMVVRFHRAGVPIEYAVRLLEEGFDTPEVLQMYSDGVPLEYATALR